MVLFKQILATRLRVWYILTHIMVIALILCFKCSMHDVCLKYAGLLAFSVLGCGKRASQAKQ